MANPKKVIKAVSRAVGGITGKGSKHVNPVYKNMDAPKKDTGRVYDWIENPTPMSDGEARWHREVSDREAYRQSEMKKGEAQRKKAEREAENRKYREKEQQRKEQEYLERRKRLGEIERMRRPHD